MNKLKLYKMKILTTIFLFMIISCTDKQNNILEPPPPPNDSDICIYLDNNKLEYISNQDISGFQFHHTDCVESVSGGDATSYNFLLSSSSQAVLGFSLSGAVIPAGSGTLIDLDGNITEDCLSDFLFSDSEGNGINVDYSIYGCNSLSVISWNIQNYPKDGLNTINGVAEILNSYNPNIIAFQEIEDNNAFNSLIENLNGTWIGYHSNPSSEYGELAYAINTASITLSSQYTILDQDEYYFSYRAPYVLEFTHQNKDYVIINNHFKCCGDGVIDLGDSSDEEYRRLIASQLLKDYIDNNYNSDNVIILGDLNDSIIDIDSDNVFSGFLQSEDYQFTDYDIANGHSDYWSYPSWPSHLDHIIISSELYTIFSNSGSHVETLLIDLYFDNYKDTISDHRPMRLNLYY